MSNKEVKIPDLGGISQATLIEWLVAPGDQVTIDTPLATLESEKATMDVPSPCEGVIEQLMTDVGSVVAEGTVIAQLTTVAEDTVAEKSIYSVDIPDLGGIDEAAVLEILISPGDDVALDDPLVTLESEKASMDVPSPVAGRVVSVHVAKDDRVSKGTLLAMLEITQKASSESEQSPPRIEKEPPVLRQETVEPVLDASRPYQVTSPIVRRLAYELDINLEAIKGTGRMGRISKSDLLAHIKSKMSSGPSAKPLPDFSKFGEVSTQSIGKIKKFSGPHLQNSWQTIPHVTQFFEADLTDLEAYRQQAKAEYLQKGARLTPIVFFMKALVKMLKKYPIFASSLSEDGSSLWMKSYYHVGIAVDTPDGLVVPVIQNVDKKSLLDLAHELVEVSQTARDGGLKPAQMQGGTVTISSLGGIGGAWFTPIINAPEVCILGISKAYFKPVYQEGQFIPRYTVPLSLSYDHRVIDGAEAARFAMDLQNELESMHNTIEEYS